MQLMRALIGGLALMLGAEFALAQSLSPMRKAGTTPSDIKGFKVVVGNPYKQRMTFTLIPMEPGFEAIAEGAQVNPSEITLAPDYARQAIVMFRIPSIEKERTIGLCVQPKDIEGPVLPRVCGTFTGRRLTAGSGGH